MAAETDCAHLNSEKRAARIVTAVEELIDHEVEVVTKQRDDRSGRLGRIRAAAESDADLQQLPALRDFLLQETEGFDLVDLHGHLPSKEAS